MAKHEPHTPTVTPRQAATDTKGAAAYTLYSEAFFKAARVGRCDGPPYIRVGRSVRYLIADLDAWLDAHRVGRKSA